MTSPSSTNLLNRTAENEVKYPTRSVTQVISQPMPAFAQPQPIAYVAAQQPRRSSNVITPLLLALIVVLVGAVALVGAWYAARQSSPTVNEAGITRSIAMRQGFQAGRERGVIAGREQALQGSLTTTALRVANAREQAFSRAFQRGEKAGRQSYRAPRYRGGYGYRSPYRYRRSGNAGLYAAFGSAQALANATGAAVDLEVYG